MSSNGFDISVPHNRRLVPFAYESGGAASVSSSNSSSAASS